MTKSILITAFVCLLASGSAHKAPSPTELIERFQQVLPGAFPNGLKDNIDTAQKVARDLSNELTGGNTKVTKDELEEARRVLKLTVVANLAMQKKQEDDLMDEEEFMRTSENEVKAAEKQVDDMIDNMVKTGVILVEERDPRESSQTYKDIMEDKKRAVQDQATTGLVSRSHKKDDKKDDPLDDEESMDLEETFGLDNLWKVKMEPKRPDMEEGGESYEFLQKQEKVEREKRAMARRWRQDQRPVGRLTSSGVLDNMESIVDEIFNAYDHDNDNSLNLLEFNELQADTDGPDSVNTETEFAELLEQVAGKSAQKLHFTTFKKLYVDPWMSEKFETVLPVDYNALLEAGKVKGESMAELWAEEDGDKELDKEIEPILKEDEEEDRKMMQTMQQELEKEQAKIPTTKA